MILDIAEEVISGYIWECNIRNYTQADHWKDKKSLYITQFDLGYPEKQYPWDANDCHDKGLLSNVSRDPRTRTDQVSDPAHDRFFCFENPNQKKNGSNTVRGSLV